MVCHDVEARLVVATGSRVTGGGIAARRQLKAAIGIIERSAAAIPDLDLYLRKDMDDIANTLARLGDGASAADFSKVTKVVTLWELIARHDAVHAKLASACNETERQGR
jgi:hypothetical protein